MTQHVVMTPSVMTVPDDAPRSGHRLKIVINEVVITKCHPSKKVIAKRIVISQQQTSSPTLPL
jgi:hypothetical protein